jgi:UDP-galactopyranose mutase
MKFDYVIVGSGLTGAVMARELHDLGESVIVLERRSHLGGNVHDHVHSSGISVHTYGPHYFRTNDDDLWSFVNRFSEFYKYEPELKSFVDGKYENWPIAGSYIKEKIGDQWVPDFDGKPANFEEASLSMMPRLVYENFVKGYSEKQWGVPATQLSTSLAKRFDVRLDDEPKLMRHKYQGIPKLGYTNFMSQILKGIPVVVNFDYLKNKEVFVPQKKLIFTGPIDEFYNFDMGKLKYRGQKRVSRYLPDVSYVQPCGQVNNPNPLNGPHIRTLEWKHMMPKEYASKIQGTFLTEEITFTPDDANEYEYPFPDEENATLYKSYRDRADSDPKTLICGRLGEYRYFDMDQAIARARHLTKKYLSNKNDG